MVSRQSRGGFLFFAASLLAACVLLTQAHAREDEIIDDDLDIDIRSQPDDGALAARDGGASLEIYGWVEYVKLLGGALKLKAKLDSGAANSSLDATDIERFERDDQRMVRFTVTDPETGDTMVLEKPLKRNVRIVRHSGEFQRRPVVELDICLGTHWRRIEVNLIDRSHFIYPMLLGRSALKDVALIDSGNTYQSAPQCSFEESDA